MILKFCHEIKLISNQMKKSYPVAGVEFCEVWNVPEQCEDHHRNDVDCAWEAGEPEEREIILSLPKILNIFELQK